MRNRKEIWDYVERFIAIVGALVFCYILMVVIAGAMERKYAKVQLEPEDVIVEENPTHTSGVATELAKCASTVPKVEDIVKSEQPIVKDFVEMVTDEKPIEEEVIEEEPIETNPINVGDSEYDLLCRCVEAEAGTEGYEGKRLVACVILNRVDAEGWGDSITEVITSKGQFSTYPRAINRVSVTDETKEAVTDELAERTDSEIIAFRSGHYHSWCTPAYKVGNHYFSK